MPWGMVLGEEKSCRMRQEVQVRVRRNMDKSREEGWSKDSEIIEVRSDTDTSGKAKKCIKESKLVW